MFDDEELEVETQAGVDYRRYLEQRKRTSPPVRAGKASGRKPYSPQFSPLATVTVRRLAWAL
jgi:hypothetical protein